MENCVIYSHHLKFPKVIDLVKTQLPKAKIELHEDGLNKSLKATLPGGVFSKAKILTINYRQRLNPSYKLNEVECALTQNLSGMAGYIRSLPANNNEVRNQLLYKVMSLNCEMSFMGEPAINAEFESVLKAIVHELDAIVFTSPGNVFNQSNTQYFADKAFHLILDANGNSKISHLDVSVDAKYHDEPEEVLTEDQQKRKSRSELYLTEKGVKVNKNLPCVFSVQKVLLRSTEDIIERSYALLIVAAKGEGVEQPHLDRAIKDKNISGFTPTESQLLLVEALTDQQRAYATWRYESLNVLLWALGKIESLPYPSAICDVPAVVGAMFKPTRDEFATSIKLRKASEILDELDKIYRMNWACVDARIKGHQVSGNLEPSVVYERHYTLNWLTHYEYQEWDDVKTNT